MFTFCPKTSTLIRGILIATVLFNSLAPRAALAKSPAKQDEIETTHPVLVENQFQSFTRPMPRVVQAQESAALQTPTVLLLCDPGSSTQPWGSPICASPNPAVSLTETFTKEEGIAWFAGGDVTFRLQCPGGNCAPPNIYYRASMDATFYDRWGAVQDWTANVYTNAHFATVITEGVQNVVCAEDVSSGSCHSEMEGMISEADISQNSNDWVNNYIDFHISLSSPLSWTNKTVEGSVEISLIPFGDPVPPESAVCKDCPYGKLHGWAADPINTNTGVFSYPVNALQIPTSAGPLSFKHTYVSLFVDQFTSPMGYGWVHNQDLRLIFPTPEDPEFLRFKSSSGNLYLFRESEPGEYTPYAGYTASLAKSTGSPVTYTLIDQAKNTYTFDEDGLITSLVNSAGGTISYEYDTSGRLERVSADSQTSYLDFGYNAQDQLTSVSDHNGRSISFGYDAVSGDLIRYTDVLDQDWSYEYQDHLLTRIEDPNGQLVERNEYYPDGKAWKQFDGEDNLVAELTYNADGTTTVTDALGHDETDTYDTRGALATETNALGGKVSKAYDPNFRPLTIKDANGAFTRLDWGIDGSNLEYIRDALNGETFISYNLSDQPIRVIDPLDYETKYFYNNTNYPTLPTRIEYPLSFDGGATYVGTDYEYYPPSSEASAGKVKFITDALGHQTYYTYASSGQIESVTTAYGTAGALATTYEYDNLGRLTDSTDEQDVVTHNEYDDAGQLLKTTRNYVNGGDPQNDEDKYNLVTEYRYDLRGNQIAVIDTYGTITRTWYDLTNRPLTVVQNLTGQTIETATPPARGSGTTEENIRFDTVYDDAGNVASSIDSAGVFTQTSYDDANRPILTIQNFVGTGDYDPAYPDQNIRTEYTYDLNGNLIATKDTAGVITRTYYDALSRPVTVVQHLTGQAISVATPPARGTSSNLRMDTYYDGNGNVIASVDPKGAITRTYYDALNRPTAVVQNLVGQAISNATPPAAGVEANIRSDTYYDEAGNVIAAVDPGGLVTRTYFDSANRPVTTVQNLTGQSIYVTTPPARGSGQTEQNVRTDIAYDAFGRRDTSTDPLGRVSKSEYNEVGQLIKTTANYVNGGLPQNDQNQRNIVTEYFYDALGRQTSVTDTAGRVSLNTYDEIGRVSITTQNYLSGAIQNYKDPVTGDQFNLITTFTYDVAGNQIAVTDTTDVITRTWYDALSRPVTVVRNLVGQGPLSPVPPGRSNPPSPLMNVRTDTVYLGTGSVDYVLDEMGRKTDYEYDLVGRLTTVSDPLLHASSYAYDANGNRTLATDAEGVVTKFEYDALNHLKAVVENYRNGITPNHEINVRTAYTYDSRGNRLSILDGKQHSTSFTYTSFGRLETETDALGNTNTYDYNAIGNRISLLDAKDQTKLFEYDELNRLELIDYPNPDADVTFAYDALGRRLSVTDGTGTTSWSYTNIDLPGQITDPFGTGVSYEYDPLGNRTELSYGSQTVSYDYGDLNQLLQVAGSGLPDPVSYEYYASGQVKSVARPNGVDTSYNYFDNGWLQDVTHSMESNPLASYQYQYDNVGNRVQAIEQVELPYVPPTVTPTPTDTSTPTATFTPTETFTPTFTPTNTFTPTSTPTNTFTPTATYTPTPYPNVLVDDFDTASLADYWEWYVPKAGPTYSLTAVPGSLRMSLPAGNTFEHWGETDEAPQLRLKNFGAGGDWAIETRLANVDAAANAGYWAALEVGFAGNDQIWFGMVDDGYLKIVRISEEVVWFAVDESLPITLRLEKTGQEYTFKYKYDADVSWTVMTVQTYPGTPTYLGLIGRGFNTGSTEMHMDWSYFRVENWSAATPTPTSTNTSTPTATATNTFTPTATGTATSTPTVTLTPSNTPTPSLTPTATNTPVPTNSGWISPSANAAASGGDGNGFQTNPANAYTDNATFAVDTDSGSNTNTSCGNAGKDKHVYRTYDLSSLPSGASILGLEVRLDMKVDNTTGAPKSCVEISWNGGTTWTTAKTSAAFTTSEATYILGGATDTWGRTWTTDELSNLRVRITNVASNASRDFSLDWAPVRVSYLPPTPPLDVVLDEFDTALLDPNWEWYVPEVGPTYSLSAVPGQLQLVVPPAKDHWVDTDEAPQVRRSDMGSGNWTIETLLSIDEANDGDQWQINLMAGFDRYDQQWLSIDNYDTVNVLRVGGGETAVAYDISLPLYLRIQKTGTQYTFKYKQNAQDPWTTLGTQTITTDVSYVGLQTRTFWDSAGDLVLNMDYFRLERWSEPEPGLEKEIEQDEFDQATLNPDWTWYAPKAGPSYALTDGMFSMTLPQGNTFEHWLYTDDAPQLKRTDLGTGDWAIEARLENISAAGDAEGYWAALHVGFDQYDQLWYGKADDGGLNSLRISEYGYFGIAGLELPLTLRLEKHGEEYTFKYKYNADEAWTVTAPYLSSGTPTYVGLITRSWNTGSANLQADWSYFRIERWEAEQGLMMLEEGLTTEGSVGSNPLPEPEDVRQPGEATRTPTPTRAITKTPTPTITPSLSDLGMDAPFFSQSEGPAKSVPVSYKLPAPFQQSGAITISYDYDPLYRLKEANYSTGDTYHYGYDAVGNRLSQENMVNGLPSTVNYLYDDANRVQSVNGVTYNFDANGNLLNDGINTYTYDFANRLKTLSNANTTANYAYNGMSDRLQETVNGNTTTFTMDYNTGLTQALSDGTNNYVYGIDRIAQVNSATEYFLGDALGSVRQLTDQGGEVTSATAYDPYGVTTSTVGASQSAYGFTGEYSDSYIKLIYLRSRMYDPSTGRFQTKDSWQGDYNRPLSLNRWMYTEANPINYKDPSGRYPVCDCGQGPIPDWWTKQLQIYIKGYGYIDPRHVQRGWDKGSWFIDQIEWALKMSYQYNLSGLGLPMTIPLNRAESAPHYWVDYAVSSNIKEEQKYGIAYGMYMDFERGYEKYQDSQWWNGQWVSGFSPADLPSDHLGFWAAMKEYKFEELPIWLQCLGKQEVLPWYEQLPGGAIFDSNGGMPENHEYLPMTKENINVAWPAFLEIQPIPSGPNTWQVVNRSFP